jgi:hypothetical protein
MTNAVVWEQAEREALLIARADRELKKTIARMEHEKAERALVRTPICRSCRD